MPSSATITAYNTFLANTKAIASDVNTNFSNHRGHNIPIETDTAAASDLTHDLGSDSHRWRTGYVREIDLETSTTTATLLIKGNTSATAGSMDILIEGSTVGSFNDTGCAGPYNTDSIPRSALAEDITLQAQTFTGSGSWTAPSGVTHALVQVQAAGGSGGGGAGADGGANGGGGGGGGSCGAFTQKVIPISGGSTYTITVGSGPTGGGGGSSTNDGSAGSTGGSSEILLGGSTLCSARGGNPGQGGISSGGTGGAGGVATSPMMVAGGGGGVAAGSGSNGNNSDQFNGGAAGGSAGSGGGGGGGGASYFGIGPIGGTGGATSSVGTGGGAGLKGAGGGGAGGGGTTGFSGNSGGTAGDGQITVIWSQ